MNSAPIRHEFLAIDEGHATLLHIDERDQSKNWIVPIGQPQSRDMQLVGGNRMLIGHHHGFVHFVFSADNGGCSRRVLRRRGFARQELQGLDADRQR